jgi:hypothetical protein
MAYPWYELVADDSLEQGDLLESCPVFVPSDVLAEGDAVHSDEIFSFAWEERDLIVLSQTCDLVKGREKLTEVLLCPVWNRQDLNEGFLSTPKGLEEVRRGNVPGFHMLARCEIAGFERDVCVVEFRRAHTLPLPFVRRRVGSTGRRVRLLPPYREHLAQAFARFYMRVGLPTDITPFR